MAKRSRLGARPGQRRPLQRSAAGARATTRPANAVTAEEMARAAELEAQILAEEQIAAESRKSRDRRTKTPAEDTAIYSSSTLAERASQEYSYVQRDLRRIAIVGGGLLIVLAVLDVLVNQLNLI
jgi:hypothetical protein